MSPLLLSLLPHLHLHLNAEKGGEREGSLGYLTLCKLIFLLVLVIRKTYANFSLHDTKEVVTVFFAKRNWIKCERVRLCLINRQRS